MATPTLRKNTLVMMLRPYAVDGQSIDRGAAVRIVRCDRTAFNTRIYTVTDGTVTLTGIPRHALALA